MHARRVAPRLPSPARATTRTALPAAPTRRAPPLTGVPRRALRQPPQRLGAARRLPRRGGPGPREAEEDVGACALVRKPEEHLAVEAPRPAQRRVKRVGPAHHRHPGTIDCDRSIAEAATGPALAAVVAAAFCHACSLEGCALRRAREASAGGGELECGCGGRRGGCVGGSHLLVAATTSTCPRSPMPSMRLSRVDTTLACTCPRQGQGRQHTAERSEAGPFGKASSTERSTQAVMEKVEGSRGAELGRRDAGVVSPHLVRGALARGARRRQRVQLVEEDDGGRAARRLPQPTTGRDNSNSNNEQLSNSACVLHMAGSATARASSASRRAPSAPRRTAAAACAPSRRRTCPGSRRPCACRATLAPATRARTRPPARAPPPSCPSPAGRAAKCPCARSHRGATLTHCLPREGGPA